MAVRTVSVLGGNWNATTAWVGGVVPIVGDTVDFTSLSGNLTVNVTTATLAGINFTNYVGIITFNANIILNTSVNLGSGGYTQAGAFGLLINNTTTIISNGTVWSRILTFSTNTSTITLSDNLYVTDNILLTSAASYTLNGNSLFVGSNLTMSANGLVGTSTIVFNGTGTWSNTSTGAVRNNVTINTLGTLTISGNVYYNTGILTHIAGVVDTSESTLNIALATTLNTSGMTWNNVTITSGIQTLLSDLNVQNLASGGAGTNTINGLFNVNVSGNLTANGVVIGTATIVLIGTGTWTATNGSNTFRTPVIINANGIITLANTLECGGNLKYIKGTVKANNTTISFTTSTLINLHKLIFKNVLLGASTTITMNEFFSGSPSLVTNVNSTSGSNYTIAFQDGFEKISKFVNISSCTLSKPLQLLVITKSKIKSTNRGIRYINQSPNGIAKGVPSINSPMTFGVAGLLSDPNMQIK
jgi:hypothetical protein